MYIHTYIIYVVYVGASAGVDGVENSTFSYGMNIKRCSKDNI